jgi:glycosyltransferase involved in cell wall biosynthesis
MSKILLITDAWKPQVNGVVTTLTNLVDQAKINGDIIYVYHPGRCTFRFSLPIYKEIKIGIPNPFHIRKLLKRLSWDHIHIATPEGPLGFCFARMCRKLNIPFSTSCHTKFPELLNSRFPSFKIEWGWKLMKHVYRDSTHILTTTETMVKELKDKGFIQDIQSWTRGVNRDIFYPIKKKKDKVITLLCVSRVSQEKGLDDFCKLNYPNTQKILVGDGPYLKELKRKYPDVIFAGKKTGIELGDYYRNADVFVFPSKTDTFGVVIIEAMACGTPIAAYPVTGPIDIIQDNITGSMNVDLNIAVKNCIDLDRNVVYNNSINWTWENCYKQFKEILLRIEDEN